MDNQTSKTLGQKISELRAQKGISQTELAEVLDVSRQSISKWETDTALPEIDKLVAISRYFGVPVGALLGLEEEQVSEPAENGELSETQLKMVQEIVDRYLAAQPKSMSKKRRTVLKIAVCLAAVCLAVGLSKMTGQLNDLSRQYHDLQYSINNVTNGVNYQISSISDRVEEVLKQQNNLTADYGTEILRLNAGEDRILFSVYAVPKTYVEGMTVSFAVDDGTGGTNTVIGEENNQKFTGTLASQLTDNISLSVIFVLPDGTRQTQLLDTYADLYRQTVPLIYVEEYLNENRITDKKLSFEQQPVSVQLGKSYCYDTIYGSLIPEIKEVRAGLFRNQQLVFWLEEDVQATEPRREDSGYGVHVYELPEGFGLPVSAGDEICIAAVIEDEAGRQFIRTGDNWLTIGEEGSNLTVEQNGYEVGGYDYAISDSVELAEWKY